MTSTVFFQIQSFCILFVFYFGIYKRRERLKHIKIMLTGIAWDIILILQIELSRSAIKKAEATMYTTSSVALKIHLFFAISSVLLYFAMGLTGRKILQAREVQEFRQLHKKLGILTIIARTLTLVTSFWAQEQGA